MTINIEEASTTLRTYLKTFVTFTDEEWSALSISMRMNPIAKKQVFVRLGEVSNTVGFVMAGSLRQILYHARK
jgi:hypothetical protein